MRHRIYRKKGILAVEFAFYLPLLIFLMLVTATLIFFVLDYTFAKLAAAKGARLATVLPPVINSNELPNQKTVTCQLYTGSLQCDGYTISNGNTFSSVIRTINTDYPNIPISNIWLQYTKEQNVVEIAVSVNSPILHYRFSGNAYILPSENVFERKYQ